MAAAAAAVGLMVAFTACAADDEGPEAPPVVPEQADDQTDEQGGEAEEVALTVMEPPDGETVSLPFEVVVDTDVPLGSIESEAPHLHVWFDDNLDAMLIVEGNSEVIDSAPDGATTMWVQVHTFDHVPASPPQEVSLTVEGGNGDGGADRGPGPGDGY